MQSEHHNTVLKSHPPKELPGPGKCYGTTGIPIKENFKNLLMENYTASFSEQCVSHIN